MQLKSDWAVSIIFGVILSIVHIPVHGYTMYFILKVIQTHIFFIWALSSAAPAFLLVFPMGLFFLKAKPFFFGGLTGVVAVVGLILFDAAYGFYPTRAFVIEYISLILFSGIAAYLGRLISQRRIKGVAH